MPTITSSSEKIRNASSAVIKTCADRLSVPKKNVKPIVIAAPPSRTSHNTLGTAPYEATRRARRDCVMSSSCRSISEITVLSPCTPEDTSVA